MQNQKKVIYNGSTFTITNIIPDFSDNERQLIIQDISDELASVFRRES